jgi:antitoxin CcdA
MRMVLRKSPAKKPVNLLVEADLLADARNKKLNISAVLDGALREALAKRWLEENAEASEENRKDIEKNGIWSDGRRMW